jgi:hypothetical protein
MAVWDVTLGNESPAQIAKLVAERSPWQLEQGRVVLRPDQTR